MFNTPILLITFNRPSHTRRVLERILEVNPKDLYIFQDGAREGNATDVQKCQEVREIINELTVHCASCTVHHNYSPINLGCGPGPMTGINWFFENVEQGIIIEDDALPHPDFFPYCEELLNKYKDNEAVRAIGSMNVDTQLWGNGSYYFSHMNRNLCAWATWKRAWMDFDINLSGVTLRQLDSTLKFYGCDKIERMYWLDRLREIHKDCCGGKSWDMQFFMSIWLHHGKGIIPNANLSSNIGTVDEATHAMAAGNIIDNVPTKSILPLKHPSVEDIQIEADRQFHYRYFEPQKAKWNAWQRAYFIINTTIKHLVGHQGPWFKHK